MTGGRMWYGHCTVPTFAVLSNSGCHHVLVFLPRFGGNDLRKGDLKPPRPHTSCGRLGLGKGSGEYGGGRLVQMPLRTELYFIHGQATNPLKLRRRGFGWQLNIVFGLSYRHLPGRRKEVFMLGHTPTPPSDIVLFKNDLLWHWAKHVKISRLHVGLEKESR